MGENAVDYHVIEDERDDPHFSPAISTDERINLVHTLDHLRPAASHSPALLR
jgi:hypothetical protein